LSFELIKRLLPEWTFPWVMVAEVRTRTSAQHFNVDSFALNPPPAFRLEGCGKSDPRVCGLIAHGLIVDVRGAVRSSIAQDGDAKSEPTTRSALSPPAELSLDRSAA
jgi:hypothetical protein